MQERKFEELEDRAVDHSLKDLTQQLESRARVIKEIEAMKAEGKALELSEEDERKFEELEDRAVDHSLKDLTQQLESRARVIKEIEAMKAEGKALELSEEEENMQGEPA